MNEFDTGARERVGRLIGAVLRQALRDSGRGRLALLERDGPETDLTEQLLSESAPELPVERVGASAAHWQPERDALLLDPANRTALVLLPDAFAAPVLPLGDLPASRVHELAGDWSAPDAVRSLAEQAGGIVALDAYLAARLDQRRTAGAAASGVPAAVAQRIEAMLAAGAWWRRRVGLVPKLGDRTVGVDFF